MKVYIAGKITGNPIYKKEFAQAAEIIRMTGNIPLNPALLPPGLSPGDYMTICHAMLDCADSVWLLENWKDSPGARIEKQLAEYAGKDVIDMAEFQETRDGGDGA